ncbi:MAG TPA: AAA family ATPase [Thermoanaerobaculia bacterium]|jgi:hypothetical protein|nr:AAA family ATPase [Thermoanaerobaculia bacterium]
MTDAAGWQRGNDAYLAAALAWLRLRLERLGDQGRPAVTPAAPIADAAPGPAAPSFRDRFRRRPAVPEAAAKPVLALPPASDAVTEQQIAEAAAAMAEAERTDSPPALVLLGQRLGLSRFERDVLLLCAALELDTRIAALCAHAQDDPARPYPTFALALALFEEPSWDALSPERPLRYWRLLEINQPGAQPLTAAALRADERIVNYLKGLNYLDDRLAPLLLPLEPADLEMDLPPSQRAVAEEIVRRLESAGNGQRLPVVQLLGPDTPSKQLVAWHAAAALGLRPYRLAADLLPPQVADLETLARLVQREMALWPFAVYLEAADAEKREPAETQAPSLQRFVARCRGVLLVDTQDVRPGLGGATVALDVEKPTPAEQRTAWEQALGENAGAAPARLAGQFSLNLPELRQIAREALAAPDGGGPELEDRLWDACLKSTRPRLESLAQRLDPRATWDDIVLPAAELDLLRQLAAQVGNRSQVYEEWGFAAKRTRGLGINALFAGESGTGKTMAAEVLANELRLNLYRIDLSAVVSKYIGETEKNLRRLFDAAEDGGALLFFDEADALFGKRSEVKDSHDRYANIEINYLLQRIEAYTGLAILATNMKSALDSAFMRRLRFIVEFRPHGEAERKAIWERIFPPETRTESLDFARLARLSLNGGSINNVAMNAAFLAARNGSAVTMPHVLAAARTEFQKLNRPINEADFRWTAPVEVVA